MSSYSYSATTNSFYPAELHQTYIDAGTWPVDAISVDDSVYQEYAAAIAPAGKVRAAGSDGMPTWADTPAPTQEQIIIRNTIKYTAMINACVVAAFPLQSSESLGTATDEMITALSAIQSFSIELANTDLTKNPVAWPAPPAEMESLLNTQKP